MAAGRTLKEVAGLLRGICVPPHSGHSKPLGHRDPTTAARHCSSDPYCRSNSGLAEPLLNGQLC